MGEADIRWLHFFQSWMYVGAVWLSRRGSKVGLFIGASAAGFWNYANLLVTTFFRNGVHELSAWFQSGELAHPDQLIAVPAWFANLTLLAGCLWAYGQRQDKRRGDLPAFLVTFTLTTGFFAAAMALLQPRYLALFPRMLHPHRP